MITSMFLWNCTSKKPCSLTNITDLQYFGYMGIIAINSHIQSNLCWTCLISCGTKQTSLWSKVHQGFSCPIEKYVRLLLTGIQVQDLSGPGFSLDTNNHYVY